MSRVVCFIAPLRECQVLEWVAVLFHTSSRSLSISRAPALAADCAAASCFSASACCEG